MTERPITIMSVNIGRQSLMLSTLLQTSTADILLIQEPWHGPIGTRRSDSDPLGLTVLGVTTNNKWRIYYPPHAPEDTCKVATYVKSDIDRSVIITNHLTHPMASPSSMVLSVITGKETLTLVNVYHHVPREGGGHALPHILSFSLDPLMPTLFMGDLNTHSPAWSLEHSDPSPWESELVDWFDEQGLYLLNPNGVPTWRTLRSDDSQRPSIIDLALLNEAAMITDQFTDLSISFDIIPSDHAALTVHWYPVLAVALQPPPELIGFAVDDDGKLAWTKFFTSIPTQPISDTPSLIQAAHDLHRDIDKASSLVFPKRKAPDPRGVRWWTPLCDAALTLVRNSQGVDRRRAVRELRNILGNAKREWAHDFLHHATNSRLWIAAKWQNGRVLSRIPSILTPNGLSAEPTDMAEAFRQRFFSASPSPVASSQPDDPAPTPTRDHIPITQSEVADALSTTSNKSAPGWSGINYKLLKWAFACRPDRFTDLFDAALTLGHHPWHDAKVVVLPKPQRPDYSLPKAYRPISLLECCGKLLEKIVAKRFLSDINLYSLLPNNQFGSRDYHSAVDAAMCLAHQVEGALSAGHCAAVVLFDISGFFDNLNVDRLVSITQNLGFPSSICAWLRSFLTDRTIRLVFNGLTSDPSTISHGTPQGSPLSPILSALYTSPLLKITSSTWSLRGLNTYVDDGAIVATSTTHHSAARQAAAGFEEVAKWLHQNGLMTDPDKTEFISFFKHRAPVTHGPVPDRIPLRDPVNGTRVVKRSSVVRYLGVFFKHNLSWDHHVTVMANRARSTVRAISILGNSVRGLDAANWRKVFHSLILPVLTYGFPLYASQKRVVGLTKTLQVAQNDAIRKMTGAFKTTPVDPLHFIAAIFPVKIQLTKLLGEYADRVHRLPPSTQLRTLRTSDTNPVAVWPQWFPISTPILRLPAPSSQPPLFSFPAHPALRHWTHPRLIDGSGLLADLKGREAIRARIKNPSYDTFQLFIRDLDVPSPPFASAFLLYQQGRLLSSGVTHGVKLASARIQACLAGLTSYSPFYSSIEIFLPAPADSFSLFRLSKHAGLTFSHLITYHLQTFLQADTLHHVRITRISAKWSGLPGKDTLAELTARHQPLLFPIPPPSLTTHKRRAILAVYQYWEEMDKSSECTSRISPPSTTSFNPQPFTLGTIRSRRKRGRRIYSTGTQAFTGHGFFKEYSVRFRPHADDNIICPCIALPPRHFTREHVLTQCPLHASPRQRHFGRRNNMNFIFGTEDGGHAFADFVDETGVFLRPLPPRPDPP